MRRLLCSPTPRTNTVDWDVYLSTSTGIIDQVLTDDTCRFASSFDTDEGTDALDLARRESLRALIVHLRALRSFFRIANHPFSEKERAEITRRDFIGETRIGSAFLLRCAELLLLLKGDCSQWSRQQIDESSLAGWSQSKNPLNAYELSEIQLDKIADAVNDLCLLAGALVEGRRVSFEAWGAFGRLVSKHLELCRASESLDDAYEGLCSPTLPKELRAIIAQVSPDPLATDVGSLFSRLYGLLELLRFVEDAMKADVTLKYKLPFFTLLREETLGFLDLIRERTLLIEGLDTTIHEHLDGTAYALRMELRKAFEHELVGLASMRNAPQIFAKVENAHGLLRDCFQQSVISVARAFDPNYDGSLLFSTFRTKLEESLLLRRELWEVLHAVRRASDERDLRAQQTLMGKLTAFREGSLRLLMYKDWEAFERFVEEVTYAKDSSELQPSLHRFHAFLETLFSQVNMRAILTDHPFTPPSDEALVS